jgi:hypothetical protein
MGQNSSGNLLAIGVSWILQGRPCSGENLSNVPKQKLAIGESGYSGTTKPRGAK